MLVNTFGKKINASLVVKNSQFYIEVAKFVQAYTVILANPNEFLKEVGEPQINADKEKISWQSLSKIMQTCDFGFSATPTNSDLLVFYNYAVEMGSISNGDNKIATVDDIADAQKIYYNFVDEAKDKAEAEFLKQHRITKLREKEVVAINKQLKSFNMQKWLAFFMSIASVILFCIGAAGLFFNFGIVQSIGSLIPIWERQYVGSIILIALALLLFYLCEKWHQNSKQEYLKLEHASQTIFSKNNSNFIAEQILKRKLDELKRDLQTIKNELNDENKTFDVKANIEKLLETNEYYKKYHNAYIAEFSAEAKTRQSNMGDSELIMGEPERQEIVLEGQFDEDAYKEKFETTKKTSKKSENDKEENVKSDELETEQKEEKESKNKIEQEEQKRKNIEQENLKKQEANSLDSISNDKLDEYISFIAEMLGEDLESLEHEK